MRRDKDPSLLYLNQLTIGNEFGTIIKTLDIIQTTLNQASQESSIFLFFLFECLALPSLFPDSFLSMMSMRNCLIYDCPLLFETWLIPS